MAKLDQLKAMLDAARARTSTAPAGAATHRPVAPHPAPHPAPHGPCTTPHRPVAGVRPAAPASVAPPPAAAQAGSTRRAIAARKHADGDIDLARAFADVKRMPPPNKAPLHRPRPAPIARQRLADDADALHASKYGAEPAPHSWDIGQELESEQTFRRAGLGTDILSKLRRGHWSVQAELDLHGMVTHEAHDALADFLFAARQQGLRCVRVIHGKGLTSPNREPVLKGKARRWLAHWDDVLAYVEAPQHAGGGGALLVLLRGK
jgi:DNA-nicking Smr family endonuclease